MALGGSSDAIQMRYSAAHPHCTLHTAHCSLLTAHCTLHLGGHVKSMPVLWVDGYSPPHTPPLHVRVGAICQHRAHVCIGWRLPVVGERRCGKARWCDGGHALPAFPLRTAPCIGAACRAQQTFMSCSLAPPISLPRPPVLIIAPVPWIERVLEAPHSSAQTTPLHSLHSSHNCCCCCCCCSSCSPVPPIPAVHHFSPFDPSLAALASTLPQQRPLLCH